MGGGKGGGSNAAPPPPAAPPAPPTQVAASQTVASRTKTPRGAANVQNEGGAKGLPTASTARALKSLTGQ